MLTWDTSGGLPVRTPEQVPVLEPHQPVDAAILRRVRDLLVSLRER